MKIGTFTAAIVAVLGGAVAAVAASPPELESLFPSRAEITVDGDGLARLVLPSEVLTACRPDLSDLRVVAGDAEVAYLIDGGLPPETAVEARKRFLPEVLEARRETAERESAPDLMTETYGLSVPPEMRWSEGWELVLAAAASRYVREVRVVAREEDGTERVVVEGTSVFRIPGTGEKDRLRLRPFGTATLEVVITGEGPGFLAPAFAYEHGRTLAESDRAEAELELLRQHPPRDGMTVLELDRPRGLVPDLIRLETATPSFSRRVEVWDVGPGTDSEPLGVADLFRLETAAGVESLELRLRPPRGDQLRVVIEDGDSPPLDEVALHAILRRPALLFSLPAGAERKATLLFGGARAYRPRYDLAGLLPPSPRRETGERALITEQLYDAGALAVARLGAVEPNPLFDPAPALAFAMDPGAEIDPRPYRHRLELSVGVSAEGLLRLQVSPAIAARARADLGDLRLIDSRGRQIAYLLEPGGGHVEIAVTPGEPRTRDGVSVYSLPLPVAPAVVDEVVLDSSKEFFDRAFELVGVQAEGKRDEVVLARGRLVRRPGDPRKLRIGSAPERLSELELRVTDGDDAPLDLFDVSLRVPAADLYFAAPPGEYALLLGHPDERAPSYELARVRDVVLTVESVAAAAGDVGENLEFSAGSRLTGGSGLQQALLWAVLAVAVVVLAWFTLRLSRARGD